MMRASMGKAVMDMAAPRNRMASNCVALSEKRPGTPISQRARPEPNAKGASMPDTLTTTALRTRLAKRSRLNSTPTRNM